MRSTISDAIRDLAVPKVQRYLVEHGLESFGVGVPTNNDVPIVTVQNGYMVVSMVDPSRSAICGSQLAKVLVGYMDLLEEANKLEGTFHYERISERATMTWAGLLRWNRNPDSPKPNTGNPTVDKIIEDVKSTEGSQVMVVIRGTQPRPEFRDIYTIACQIIGVNPEKWSIPDQMEFMVEFERFVEARIEIKFVEELPKVLTSIVATLQREVETRELHQRLSTLDAEIKRLQQVTDDQLLQAGIAAVVRAFKQMNLTVGIARMDHLKQLYPNHVAEILKALEAAS